jgi:probable F420-dependent oxidoreductase
MKIGLLAFVTDSSASPAAVARKAEALGFDSLWLPEHPIIPVHHRTPYPVGDGTIPENYAHLPDPFVALALAAGATSRIKLGTGICLVPERDPIVMAKEVATLDFYSGGRLLLGIGGGWLADETEIFGVEFRKRWAVTREYVAAMKRLWIEPQASFEGKFVNFPPVKSYPKPAQKPHPPIIIGAGGLGAGNERALRDTVAMGDGWMPIVLTPLQLAEEMSKLRKMCAEAGRDFSRIEISMLLMAPGDDPARELEEYGDTGAQRLVLTVHALEPGGYERELEGLARAYLC